MRIEEQKRQMTTDDMQRFIDSAMGSGMSYKDALVMLAHLLGLHPVPESINPGLAEMWMEMRF